MTLKVN